MASNEVTTFHRERITVAIFAIILLFLFAHAFLSMRTEIRDDIRRQDITNLKRALEQYNNKYTYYVSPPTTEPECTTSNDSASWFFGATSPLLTEKFIDALPHDVRESTTRSYRYCVTDVKHDHATGFFLEATLERPQTNTTAVDEDEQRKYEYRVLNESNHTLYRVCGGTETQCQP